MNIIGFNIAVHSRLEPFLPTAKGHSKQPFKDMSKAHCGLYVCFLFLSGTGTYIWR